MQKRIVIISIIILLTILLFGGIIGLCIVEKKYNIKVDYLGVWCWDEDVGEEYLNFAMQQGVNEIYYCAESFGENNKTFIKKAKALGMKVYWLCGRCEWIESPEQFDAQMAKYLKFNQENPSLSYAGVHMDVEPHQFDDFHEKRAYYIEKYIDFVEDVTKKYSNINFDFDIPFWLDDEVSKNGETKEAYKFVIDLAQRVFVMSYRDTAEKIYSVGKEELEYATQNNKYIFLCVDTKDLGTEQNQVTFYEEGKKVLKEELKKLKSLTQQAHGISVHHLKSWYELKN